MQEFISGNSIVLSGFFQRKKNLIYLICKIMLTAGVLSFIIYKINYKEIISSINSADLFFLSAAFLLLLPNVFLQFYKWKILCNNFLDEHEKKKILYSLFYGFAAGIFTPARAGEYFGRGLAFKNRSLIDITLLTFTDKLFTLIIILLTGIISLIFFIYYFYPGYLNQVVLLLILSFLLLLLAYFFCKNKKIRELIRQKINSLSFYRNFIQSKFLMEKFNKKVLKKLLIINSLYYLCFILQFVFLAAAFSGNLKIISYTWSGSLLMVSKSFLPIISIGELGIREGLSVYFLTIMGELTSVGFNASIFLFLINLLIPSLVGMFLIIAEKKR